MSTIDKIIIRLVAEGFITKKELCKYINKYCHNREKLALNFLQKIQQRKELPITRNGDIYKFADEETMKDAEHYLFCEYLKTAKELLPKTYPERWKRWFFSL